MQITYREPSLAHSIDSILLFQTEGTGGWWMDALYQFYPQLDRGRMERGSNRGQMGFSVISARMSWYLPSRGIWKMSPKASSTARRFLSQWGA